MSNPEHSVEGHARWVRISHWILAASVLTLAFSGFVILMSHPRLYWGKAGNDLTPALFELPISRNYRHGGWAKPVAFKTPISAVRVARPGSYSLAQLKSLPSRTQITKLTCEEGSALGVSAMGCVLERGGFQWFIRLLLQFVTPAGIAAISLRQSRDAINDVRPGSLIV